MGLKYGGRSIGQRTPWKANSVGPANMKGGLNLPELRFSQLVAQLEPVFQEVVRRALFNEPGRFEKFALAPASVNGHHRAQGGNLVHTIDVAECALMLASHYEGLVDKDIVLTAALLHDLGKCEEYEQTPRGTFMSESGKMVGHKAIGSTMVWAALEPLRHTSAKRALAVMNVVASAAGRSYELRGHASLEALIVNKADQLSAAADLYRESLRNSGNSYYGVKHPHMQEHPRHPVALIPEVRRVTPTAQSPRLSRSQRFNGL